MAMDNAPLVSEPEKLEPRWRSFLGSTNICKAVPFVSSFGNRVNVSLSKWRKNRGADWIGARRNGVHVPAPAVQSQPGGLLETG